MRSSTSCLVVVMTSLFLGTWALGKDAESVEERTSRLIQQLGAKEYATREKAQAELQKIGLSAFDALLSAQQNDDIEVVSRVRFLLRSMHPVWARETDPPEVRKLLNGYGDQHEDERRSRMEKLAKLDDQRGLESLGRLVQYELDERLSKRAALLLMEALQPLRDKPGTEELETRLNRSLGNSRRVGANWVRLLARSLRDPTPMLRDWDRASRLEQESYLAAPDKQSREIARDLLRWQAELLAKLNRREESIAVIRRTIKLLDGTREELLDTTDWVGRQELWSLVEEIARYFPDRFNDLPPLIYRLAEAQLRQGRKDVAQQTADRALAVNVTNSQEHNLVALWLQERGLFDWAEREYRYVLDREPTGSFFDLRARFSLSEMLHDGQQDDAAAKVLQGVADAMDKDMGVTDLISRMGREPGGVRSRMHYFYSQHAAASGNRAEQLEQLEKAAQHDPSDADVLIAMFRVPNPEPNWRTKTRQLIKDAAASFREEVTELRQRLEQIDDPNDRETEQRQLAHYDNQYAWLVGNTEGDYDDALRASLESVELTPDSAGLMDTLGRCYFAKGDLENAIKFQTKAVKREPHTRQIRRQLEFFEAERAKRNGR